MSPDDQRPTSPLQVVVTDGLGRPLRRPALVGWLRSVAPSSARGHLTVALVTDGAMRRLNRDYAGHDYVTDVLSFAADARPPGRNVGSGRRGAGGLLPHLGDVVIATGAASRQARAGGHAVTTELRILALHGLLHLLGYDHAADGGEMARMERRLRQKGGLREGLIERGNPADMRAGARSAERLPAVARRANGSPAVARGAKARGRRR